MREIKIPSVNGKDLLHVVIWEPEKGSRVCGVVQISHGMVEYVKRFEGLAEFLTNEGYVVLGNDHLGHGETAKPEDLGYFGPGLSRTVVEDLHEVTKFAKETYGDVPVFLFGHSMGSFLARRYIMTYGGELDGAIISGTGGQPAAVLKAGQLVAGLIGTVKGERHRSKLLKTMAFSGYNKRIPDAQTPNDWLTKDRDVVTRYNQDPFCTFSFTVNGYKTLFDMIEFIQRQENIAKIPKDLPVLLIAGEEDPVGGYGKDVEAVRQSYEKAGLKDLGMKLYPGDRHELTNELDREQVYRDLAEWLQAHTR